MTTNRYQTEKHIMSQARLNDASASAIHDRYHTSFTGALTPHVRYEQMPGADERIVFVVEFAAYRLGEIDEKLGRLTEIMGRGAARSSQLRK